MNARSTRPAWVYDDSPLPDPAGFGERAVSFIRRLRHPASTLPGQAFQLDRWQERIIRRVFGDVDENGQRRVRKVFLMVGRGNRKTSLGAAIGLLFTVGHERRQGGQNYVAAVNRDQAGVAFREACGIVGMIPALGQALHIINEAGQNNAKMIIRHGKSGSSLEALAADGKAQHGKTPYLALIDELHAFPRRDLFDAIATGMAKTPNSLLFVITTAGAGQEGVAWEEYSYARRVALGEIDDPSYLPILFEPDHDADWQSEATWRDGNPGLDLGYPDLAALRADAEQARHVPAKAHAFKQYNANMWQDAALSTWLDMDVYDRGAEPLDIEALRELPCWIGVDFSLVNDLTAVVAVFRDEDDTFHVLPRFFVPETTIARKSVTDGASYKTWREAGHIETTPGDVMDEEHVENAIREWCDEFDVQEIDCDPWKLKRMMARLAEDGLPVVEIRQGWATMAPLVEQTQRAILAGQVRHGGHPVLRWCFANVVTRTDAAGNASFHKGKSTGRIDGAVATAMALGRAAAGEGPGSIYNDPNERPAGLLIIGGP
jgi:phage terminase large subunit-like protein